VREELDRNTTYVGSGAFFSFFPFFLGPILRCSQGGNCP